MAFPLKETLYEGPVTQIPKEWYETVARILNHMQGLGITIEIPAQPSETNPVIFRLSNEIIEAIEEGSSGGALVHPWKTAIASTTSITVASGKWAATATGKTFTGLGGGSGSVIVLQTSAGGTATDGGVVTSSGNAIIYPALTFIVFVADTALATRIGEWASAFVPYQVLARVTCAAGAVTAVEQRIFSDLSTVYDDPDTGGRDADFFTITRRTLPSPHERELILYGAEEAESFMVPYLEVTE